MSILDKIANSYSKKFMEYYLKSHTKGIDRVFDSQEEFEKEIERVFADISKKFSEIGVDNNFVEHVMSNVVFDIIIEDGQSIEDMLIEFMDSFCQELKNVLLNKNEPTELIDVSKTLHIVLDILTNIALSFGALDESREEGKD